MYSATAILISSAALCAALPTSHVGPRAGGPAIMPIPSTCAVTNPLPNTSSNSNTSYIPAPSTNNDILYNAYYSSFSTNATEMATQCLQQCYGYGTHTECKTAFWAENMLVPKGYYGGEGGYLATGCVMFERELGAGDFEVAPEGQGKSAFAGTIKC